jgi:hypothetical protein
MDTFYVIATRFVVSIYYFHVDNALRLATVFFGRMISATPIDSINIPCPS